MNIEAYGRWRSYIPGEVLKRNGLLFAKYDTPVITIVYILEGGYEESQFEVKVDAKSQILWVLANRVYSSSFLNSVNEIQEKRQIYFISF